LVWWLGLQICRWASLRWHIYDLHIQKMNMFPKMIPQDKTLPCISWSAWWIWPCNSAATNL
jgi:hypothetical protein